MPIYQSGYCSIHQSKAGILYKITRYRDTTHNVSYTYVNFLGKRKIEEGQRRSSVLSSGVGMIIVFLNILKGGTFYDYVSCITVYT